MAFRIAVKNLVVRHVLYFILLFLISCGKDNYVNEQTSVIKEYIDSNLEDVPKYMINLDECPEFEPHPLFTIESIENPGNDVFINKPFDCTKMNDTLYVTDLDNNCINVISGSKLIRKIGREGKGPFEFHNPMYIANSTKKVAISNAGTSSVKLFDDKFEYLTSFPSSVSFGAEIRFRNDNLYIKHRQPSRILLQEYQTLPPYAETGKYITNYSYKAKRKPSQGADGINFTIMQSGDVLLSYRSTPYLFRYDSLCNLKEIVEMEGEFIDTLHRKDLPKGWYRHFTVSMNSKDNTLYLLGKQRLYVFSITDKIRLVKRFIFPKGVWNLRIFDNQIYTICYSKIVVYSLN